MCTAYVNFYGGWKFKVGSNEFYFFFLSKFIIFPALPLFTEDDNSTGKLGLMDLDNGLSYKRLRHCDDKAHYVMFFFPITIDFIFPMQKYARRFTTTTRIDSENTGEKKI